MVLGVGFGSCSFTLRGHWWRGNQDCMFNLWSVHIFCLVDFDPDICDTFLPIFDVFLILIQQVVDPFVSFDAENILWTVVEQICDGGHILVHCIISQIDRFYVANKNFPFIIHRHPIIGIIADEVGIHCGFAELK